MNSKSKILLVVAIMLISVKVFSQSNCNVRKNDDGIVVYLCDPIKTKYKSIKVELDMPATLSQYAAKLLDIGNYHSWQYKAIETRVVNRLSDTELYYYTRVEAPWPVTNRDLIIHLKFWQDKETHQLYQKLKSVPDFLPEEEGFVRVPFSESLLIVTPVNNENVSVEFTMEINPGGYVAPWIANMFAAVAPWNTFNNFRNNIISQGENRITVPFVEDFP